MPIAQRIEAELRTFDERAELGGQDVRWPCPALTPCPSPDQPSVGARRGKISALPSPALPSAAWPGVGPPSSWL